MNRISSIPIQAAPPGALEKAFHRAEDGPSFKTFLLESLDRVNAMQQDADRAVEKLFGGDEVNPAEVLTAVQKADMSFRLLMQIRNKLVEAYRELQQMRV